MLPRRKAAPAGTGLGAALRFQAFAGLAHRLQAFDVHFGRWAHDDTARLSGPDDPWVSDWPTSPNEARRLLSALLRLLTPGERARLLLALTRTSSSLTSEGVLWLLDEGRALPRTGRHDVALVHAAAAWLARCPESEGHAVMAGLWQDVVALAAGHRAAALLHINDFVRRHGCAPSLRQPLAAELARLSPHDRKGEPTPSAHGSGPYKRKAGAALQPPH